MAFPTSPTNGQIFKNYVFRDNKWSKFDQEIITLIGPTSITSGVPLLAFNLAGISGGTYAFEISWDAFLTEANNPSSYIIWNGKMSGVLPMTWTNTYNEAPALPIAVNSQVHHILGINLPTLTMDSDYSTGSYGNHCIYMNANYTTFINGMTMRLRRILA